MAFRIRGIDPAPFRDLYALPDADLLARGARRYMVDASPGFPDRVELRDLEPGERALLVNYVHQPADTPYRASHAIFVREGAEQATELVDTVPEVMRRRILSLRAFDAAGMLVDAELVEGADAAEPIERLLALPHVDEVHAHYARFGCFAARIIRNDA